MGRLLALLLALMVGSWIAFADQRLPESEPASTAPTMFSGERAFRDVQAMAAAPHPTGSPANTKVRDAIVARMAEYGLAPQVRPGVGVEVARWARNFVSAAQVENIVGVIPGRDRTAPAVALMAHYDSVPGSPGAADDLLGVASALETARAIAARGMPARDVMLIFTDGEEIDLLGANHFFRRDPLARRVGFVINLEARGSGGRAQMFQTSPQNGDLIERFRSTARRPASSSLAVLVYEKMPNDTDLTASLRAGIDGMNYAIIGRQFDYHSPTASAQNLERGSLQDMGDQALAMAGELAFASTLPARAPARVYANVFGDSVLAYPEWVGWLLVVAIAALLMLAVRWARRSGEFPATDLLRGAGAFAFVGFGAAAILEFARRLTGAEFGYLEQRVLLAQAQRWEWAIALVALGFMVLAAAELSRARRWVAVLPLAAGLAASAFGGIDWIGAVAGAIAGAIGWFTFGRPVGRQGAWAGGLLFSLVLLIAAQVFAPGAAFVLAWPLLIAALGAALTRLGDRPGLVPKVLLGALAAVTLGWAGGFFHLAFQSMDLMPVLGLLLIPAAMVLWPLAQPDEGRSAVRIAGAMMLVAGLALTFAIRTANPWTPRTPQITYVGYQLDQDTGKAWRFGLPSQGGGRAWTDQVLMADGGAPRRARQWWWSYAHDMAPARPIAAPAPALALARGPAGDLRLSVTSPPGARTLELRVRASTPASVTNLGGTPLTKALPAGKWVRFYWVSQSAPFTLGLQPTKPGRLDVAYAAGFDRWPADAAPLPPRPANLMPWDDSDSTFVTGTRAFTWR